jgi:trans-2,3-dihydro-3-hydroxyanthranilate isomerase
MLRRNYAVYDVFTAELMAGNPLAVVFDGEGLDTAAMQQIAGEFNLSETVFILPPANPRHRARVRIFTPRHELPFAGHPTVGSAVALFESAPGSAMMVLEETVGLIRCEVARDGDAAFASFTLPRVAEKLDFAATDADVAAALGLEISDIGFDDHKVGLWTGGVPYVTVPLASAAAAGRAKLDERAWVALTGPVEALSAAAFIYCREAVFPESAFHARMFAPHLGIPEDPATGSAVAALAGALTAHEGAGDGTHRYWVEQGVEMGRPSRIRLDIDVVGGVMTGGRMGGHAVRVAEGTLLV